MYLFLACHTGHHRPSLNTVPHQREAEECPGSVDGSDHISVMSGGATHLGVTNHHPKLNGTATTIYHQWTVDTQGLLDLHRALTGATLARGDLYTCDYPSLTHDRLWG
jgi:hypothetical protein